MRNLKTKVLGLLLLTSGISFAQHTDEINTNRPGKSFGAFSVGKNVIQAETGVYYIKEKHKLLDYDAKGFGLDLTARYGALLEQLEFIAEMQYQTDKYSSPYLDENRNGFKQLTVGAKYLFYDPWKNYKEKVNVYSWKANKKFKWRKLLPAVGFYAGANFNVGDNPYTFPTDPKFSPKVMVLLQNHFGEKTVLTTNLIADKFITDYPTYGYILTLSRAVGEQWSVFFENQGYMSDWYSDSIIRGGAAYLLKKNMQLDASIGTNFKDTPSILGAAIGFSWRFDKNYKPIEIKDGKETKGATKGKKAEMEKQKRNDEVK
ncbi:transporter [Flavobacterium sp. SM15]|uniref:transporter n=1 Tax=Flavobacterium sp. SM15 TaxID=2908005 RepID=UPI001EDB960E|nr:transporter [Flavobacterium sp. SM15]MCG2611848.1 transporter [Flavobacterium sp. SM15]